ncbi:hypothetical protein CWS43_26170 [Rahnella sp. AA]|uniref:hypothetical protein n=1 Tax=Rahnella sp. AA TaxID=2057180 RepID=UPI000C325DB5|nr:hypothetical protein [Rahnella sp. AA]PKE27613.1 hypothetical protein CWS43_26170 [Rahnella sp. AA]
MFISKNNRFPFLVLTGAFVVYFGCWAYINQHTAHASWMTWRIILLIGCIFLGWIVVTDGNDEDGFMDILMSIWVTFVMNLIVFTVWSIAVWHLPQLDADDIKFLFVLDAVFVGFVREIII